MKIGERSLFGGSLLGVIFPGGVWADIRLVRGTPPIYPSRVNPALFVRVHIKQYWNFQRDTTTQITFCQSSYKTILAFLESFYQTMLHKFVRIHITQYIFRKLLLNNTTYDLRVKIKQSYSRVTPKQYYK